MSNSDLGVRFTEEKYATKNEVVNDLHITAIDSFWSNILTYRAQYNRYSTLRTVDSELIATCCCNSINALIYNVENKLLCLNREFVKVYSNNEFLSKLNDLSFNRIKKCGLSANYIDSLKNFYSNFSGAYSEDFLADIYSKINNVSEITSFYRNNDAGVYDNSAVIDRIFNFAPSSMVEKMMDDLFAFSVNNTFSSIVKFAEIYSQMVFIKPFDKNNREIAMIFAKSNLAKNSLGELAMILPFEEILVNESVMSNFVKQTQKTKDYTYFIKYFLEKVLVLIDEYIALCKRDDIPMSVSKETRSTVVLAPKESVAVLNRYEIQLVQEDPRLKKKEAHFYSRHHEIGRKYSIAEYKKFNRCVYETARTSMDHLAELGYYKKIQVKNKFIYETIKR